MTPALRIPCLATVALGGAFDRFQVDPALPAIASSQGRNDARSDEGGGGRASAQPVSG